jgi:hypothetical protein
VRTVGAGAAEEVPAADLHPGADFSAGVLPFRWRTARMGHEYRQSPCAEDGHVAIVEDNEACNSKVPDRYERILNPRMIFKQDETGAYGRDNVCWPQSACYGRKR